MKKKLATILKSTLIIVIILQTVLRSQAQKTATGLSKDVINKIAVIVEPLREQADKLLSSDATGTFKAYQADIAKLNNLKSSSEKSQMASKIKVEYNSFFKDVWSEMKVDEEAYQSQLKNLFPADISEKVMFESYLNFTINSSSAAPAPPPTPKPDPENKCIDVCPIAAGSVTGASKLVSSGGGSYGNCFLKANSWVATVGGNNILATLKNNITIPGTLPSDSRNLRVKTRFELKQEATAFAVLNTTISETRLTTYDNAGNYVTDERLEAIAPVLFGISNTNSKTIIEEYVIPKTEINKVNIQAFASTVSGLLLIGGGWTFSEATDINWTICEEK